MGFAFYLGALLKGLLAKWVLDKKDKKDGNTPGPHINV